MKINKQVREAWNFVSKGRRYFIFIIVTMLFGGVLGFVFSSEIGKVIEPFLDELIKSISGLGLFRLIVFILQNNMKVAFLGVIFGIVFGIFPVVNSVVNGAVIGYVIKVTLEKASFVELWRILPHGIFEIPAIIIALGMGLKLGVSVFNRRENFRESFYNCMNVFLFILIPLLVLAAVIEGILISLIG